jgi:hypothetical protein
VVMHPHTKYNWPILKDKKVMVRKKKNQTETICLPSFERET